jgi:glycosyltransferase involved in cell wall biosynthesis
MIVLNPCTSDARVIKTAESAAAAGHEVRVFCTLPRVGSAPERETRNGVTYERHRWGLQGPVSRALGSLLPPENLAVDVIATFLYRYFSYRLVGSVFADAMREFRPDIIHAHDLIPLPFAVTLGQALGAKVIYDAHELEAHRNPPLPAIQRMVVQRMERSYGRRADAVITVGDMIAGILKRELQRDDVNVIYNAPLMRQRAGLGDLRRDCGLRPDQPLIVYVGKITINRGIEDVLRALRELPEFHFAVVGPGRQKERDLILRAAADLNVTDRLHLIDPVDHADVVAYAATADIGVVPLVPKTKSYELAMPNKLFELSLARLPVVASDLPEIGRVLREIGNGEFYDPRKPEEIAGAIRRAFARRHELRPSDTAYESLVARYSWPAQAEKLARIYRGLLSQGQAVKRGAAGARPDGTKPVPREAAAE